MCYQVELDVGRAVRLSGGCAIRLNAGCAVMLDSFESSDILSESELVDPSNISVVSSANRDNFISFSPIFIPLIS